VGLSAIIAVALEGVGTAGARGTRAAERPGVIQVARVREAFGPVSGLVGPLKDLHVELPPSEFQDWSFDKGGFPVVSVIAYRSVYLAHRESVFDLSGRIHAFVPCGGCKPLRVFCAGCRTLRVKNVLVVFERPRSAATRLTAGQRRALRGDLAELGSPVSP
jgi:hypothetical protein